jgi:intein/homing endonuclease
MSWPLFDRIRAYANYAGVHQQERVFQDQSSLDRLLSSGEFIDFNQQQALLDQTNLQINRLERYKDYEQMDEVGEISLALDLYADEASMADPERRHTLVIKSLYKDVQEELEDLFFQRLAMDNQVRPMVRYVCKYGDFPAEIVPTQDRKGVGSLKFMNVYNFTRVETKFGDLIGFYYQDELMAEPVFLHPWQVMHLRLTSFENIYHPYGRCGNILSRIWTPTGSKVMKDLQPGDEVYCLEDRKAVTTKVVKFISSGSKSTVVIKTKHRTIQVTPEHPVLVVIKDNYIITKFGVKRDISTQQYVLASELVVGDKLILPKIHDDGVLINLDAHKIIGHAGRNFLFPVNVDVSFAKLIGFLIGDGWTSANNSKLEFAEGIYPDLNQKYIDIIKSYGFVGEPYHREGEFSQYGKFVFSAKELAQTCANMGLIGRAWEKRIPTWVFIATEEIKLAFIEGLVDSDGSTNIDEWGCERFQIELTSEELVKDLKVLLDQMNYKCGNISKRNRKEIIITINDTECQRRNSWVLYWYNSKMPSGDLSHQGSRRTKYLNNSDDYLVETIVSIEDGGEIEVGDIQVESSAHNFIADGVVVHNSILEGGRKAFKQLRLMEDAALIYRITRAPEKRMFKIPVGNIPAKEVPEYIQAIARQYKNNRFFDPRTGNFNERFSPLIQEDDFFLPVRPDGSGPTIETLKGAQNLDDIKDIEYFKKKMIAPTKIPFARVGIGADGSGQGHEKSLSSTNSEFSKAVQWVQREVSMGLTKVAICHLAMAGYSIEQIKGFSISMSATSAIDELYRIETWGSRATVMANLKDLGWFPKEWIVTRFTDLSPEEIQELDELQQQEPADGGGGGGGGGGGAPPPPPPTPEAAGNAPPPPDAQGDQPGSIPPASPDDEAPAIGDQVDQMAGMQEHLIPGLDSDLEKSVLLETKNALIESKRQARRSLIMESVKKYRDKQSRQESGQYTYLLEQNELNGLESGTGAENKVLVESTISDQLSGECRNQYHMILCSEADPNCIVEQDVPEGSTIAG